MAACGKLFWNELSGKEVHFTEVEVNEESPPEARRLRGIPVGLVVLALLAAGLYFGPSLLDQLGRPNGEVATAHERTTPMESGTMARSRAKRVDTV